MNHPKREEWAPYLFGDATPEARQHLAEHLQRCPECAAEIAGWQRSLRKLDRWRLPRLRPRSARGALSRLKWGIAAALLLGTGVGLGRWSVPAVDLNSLQIQIEASVKSSLAVELRRQLHPELQSALARVVEESALETRRQIGGLAQGFDRAREEDRQITLAWFEQIRKQHAADYLSLRNDLETVASLTDEEIRRARQSLNQLAVNKPVHEP